MVTLTAGRDVHLTLAKAIRDPRIYREVVVCSPFIEGRGMVLLDTLVAKCGMGAPRVSVISTPSVAMLLRSRWSRRPGLTITAINNLHAKVYAVLGHLIRDHQAIVTSANLTGSGLGKNLELGIRLTGKDAGSAQLIEMIPMRLRHSH